jgi:hypothetical protein
MWFKVPRGVVPEFFGATSYIYLKKKKNKKKKKKKDEDRTGWLFV